MIPRADIESIPYVVGLAALMLYIYLLQVYDVRKRFVEYLGLVLLVVGSLVPLGFTLYNLWSFNLEYSYVFGYTYSGMEPLERAVTSLFSMPWDVAMLAGVSLYIVLRILLSGSMYRSAVRSALSAYLFSLMPLLLVPIFYPPYEIYEDLVALDGMGLHPVGIDGVFLVEAVLTYVVVAILLGAGGLGLYLWRNPVDRVYRVSNTLLYLGIFLVALLYFLRIWFNLVFGGRDNFLNYTSVDVAILTVLASSLLAYQVRRIAGTRVIGASAVASYLVVLSATLLVATIHPDAFFPYNSVLNTGVYLAVLLSTLFVASFPVGREIFRRSFLPWFSEKMEVMVRSGSALLLLVISGAFLIVLFNLSIYSTFGEGLVRISEDFLVSSVFLLSIYPMISMIGELIARRFNSINGVIFGVFGIYAVFAGGFNNNIWIIRDYAPYFFIASIPIGIFLGWRYRHYPVARIVFSLLFGLLLITQAFFVKGPATDVTQEEPYTVDGLTLSNPRYNTTIVNDTVYLEPGSNETTEMLSIEEARFDGGIVLRRYSFNAREIRFSQNILVDSPPYMYVLGLITGSEDRVSIYASQATWMRLLYLVMPLLLVGYLYLARRFDRY